MPCSVVDPVIVDVRKQCKDAEIIPGCMMIDSSNIMMEEFLSDCESCLFFNFEECTRKEDVAQIHSSVANGDNSWLQYDKNGRKHHKYLNLLHFLLMLH